MRNQLSIQLLLFRALLLICVVEGILFFLSFFYPGGNFEMGDKQVEKGTTRPENVDQNMGDSSKLVSRRKKKRRGKKEGNGENGDYKEGDQNEAASASSDQSNQSSLPQSTPDQSNQLPLTQSSPDQSDQSSSNLLHDEKPNKKADPNKLSLLTWNIDGLDLENIKERFSNLIDHLIEYHPDVVLLQEVIPPLVKTLKEVLKPYHVLQGDDRGYFTAILLRKSRLQLLDSRIVKYPTTKMQRNLLMAHVSFLGRPLCVMTSHLESMKEGSKERVTQVKQVWRSMDDQPSDFIVIFGGDTNLRNYEVIALGGLPWGIRDVWESLGCPKDCSFTWDMLINNNKDLSFAPRHRFDRLFLRQPMKGWRATAEDMVLVGLERLECCRFISDHWGILCTFTINPPDPPLADER